MNQLATIASAAVRFDPEARSFAAYRLGGGTTLLGDLTASTLDHAAAEATERWSWDRGDRLGIRETGQEEAPQWPFQKQPLDRMHVYAVRRSAPLRWELDKHGRSRPICKHKLELICAIDLLAVFR